MQKTGFFDQSFLKTKFVAAVIVAWYANAYGEKLATDLERNNIILQQGDKVFSLGTFRNNAKPSPSFVLMEIEGTKANSYVFDPDGGVTLTEGFILYDDHKNVKSLNLAGPNIKLFSDEPQYQLAHKMACKIADNLASGPRIPGTDLKLPLFKGNSEKLMADGMMFKSLQICPTPKY